MAVLSARSAARAVCHAAAAVIALFGAPERLDARGPQFDPREVKAVFLLNFSRFAEWPPDAFSGPASPLVIGVVGEDPFGRTLDDAVRGESVKGHPLAVARYRTVEEIGTCHVLFISASEAKRYERIFAALHGRPILTIGETDGFATHGGMIRFLTEGTHIRLRINAGAARAAGVIVSSRILRAAEIVETARTP